MISSIKKLKQLLGKGQIEDKKITTTGITLEKAEEIKYLKTLKENLMKELFFQIKELQWKKHFQEVMIVGIGTNLIEGNFDTFGPRVGSLLKEIQLPNYVKCYGNMDFPIHAKNLVNFMEQYKQEMKNSLVIAVDAVLALRKEDSLGSIKVVKHGIYPGQAVGKNLDMIGDLSIIGFTSRHYPDIEDIIKSGVNKEILTQMSETTAEVLSEGISLSLKR